MLLDYINFNTACVYGIYGHLGGGKTLTAVDIMLSVLPYENNCVYTNIRLRNLPEEWQKRVFYFDDLNTVDAWSIPCGSPRGSGGRNRVFIFIDEVAEFFDQYSNNSPILRRFLSWLRHSSKRGQWVFLIVQHPNFISADLRRLINWWVRCDDMDNFRVPVIRLKMPFLGGSVKRVVIDRNFQVVSRGLNLCDKYKVGYFYDTSQSIATLGRNANVFESSSFIPFRGFLFVVSLALVWLFILVYCV